MTLILITLIALIVAILIYKKGRRDALKDERNNQYYNNPIDEHSPENLDPNKYRNYPPLDI
jgi:hypothetical protein